MASPQKENGFTPIANEIMEALSRTRIPGQERQVLDAILRKTYGWNKCEDHISMGQIAKLTGLKRQNVGRSIKALHQRNIISVVRDDHCYLNLLKLNKDYETWVSSRVITGKGVITGDDRSVITQDDKSVITGDAHKRKKEKKTIPLCPHREIIDAYNSILGPCLPVVKLKLWPGTPRERSLLARWGEDAKYRTLDFWIGLFEYIRDKCPFLLGANDNKWKADLGWIVKKDKFAKILEGNYERR